MMSSRILKKVSLSVFVLALCSAKLHAGEYRFFTVLKAMADKKLCFSDNHTLVATRYVGPEYTGQSQVIALEKDSASAVECPPDKYFSSENTVIYVKDAQGYARTFTCEGRPWFKSEKDKKSLIEISNDPNLRSIARSGDKKQIAFGYASGEIHLYKWATLQQATAEGEKKAE